MACCLIKDMMESAKDEENSRMRAVSVVDSDDWYSLMYIVEMKVLKL